MNNKFFFLIFRTETRTGGLGYGRHPNYHYPVSFIMFINISLEKVNLKFKFIIWLMFHLKPIISLPSKLILGPSGIFSKSASSCIK